MIIEKWLREKGFYQGAEAIANFDSSYKNTAEWKTYYEFIVSIDKNSWFRDVAIGVLEKADNKTLDSIFTDSSNMSGDEIFTSLHNQLIEQLASDRYIKADRRLKVKNASEVQDMLRLYYSPYIKISNNLSSLRTSEDWTISKDGQEKDE